MKHSPVPEVMTAKTMIEAAVGLGSNLGDRLQHLRKARERIATLPETRLLDCSPVYETEPVGVPEAYRDKAFLNAVLICETGLSPDEWSERLHAIEDDLWRIRTGERNAPRTIDIDLLTHGDTRITRPDLTLPHPQCSSRRFVCQPLADLRPALILPGHTSSISQILAQLPTSPTVVLHTAEW